MASERSATRRGRSRRSRGVARRLTSGESSGVVGWLTIGGARPPPGSAPSARARPAADAATAAAEARTAPGAAIGWPWIDATSSSQLWNRSAGSFISIRLMTSKIRRSSAVIS